MSEAAKNELPKNWMQGQIKDLVTIRNGYAFKSKDFKDKSGVPVIRQTNLSSRIVNFNKPKYLPAEFLDEFESYKINKGDVLIGLSGSIGNLSRYLLDEPALQNQRTGLLVEHVPGSIKYVENYLQLIKEQLLGAAKGVAVQNISSKTIESWNIPIAPLEQQKRIVAKIEELFSHIDAGIEALKKAKQLLKQYRQSVLKAAVTGELTKEWRKENKDKLEPASKLIERILKERHQKWEEKQFEQFKAKGKIPKDDKWKGKYKVPISTRSWGFLGVIPESWSWVSVDQMGDSQEQPVLTGPFGSNLGKSDFTQEGVPVLTIGCLQEEGIDLNRAMHVSKEKAEELSRYKLKEGDMLFSRMAAVGRAGFVKSELAGALFNYHIMRLRLHPHVMVQEYFVSYVRGSSQVYDYVKEVNHGATRDGINTQQLLEMPVALAPLEEQREICKLVGEKLSAIRLLESDINIQLLKAEKNKQSILVSAFSGKFIHENN